MVFLTCMFCTFRPSCHVDLTGKIVSVPSFGLIGSTNIIIVQYIPDKIRNATRRTDQLSGRSQVMGQFRLYRCKGMSGTAALHIVCNQASKMCTKNWS